MDRDAATQLVREFLLRDLIQDPDVELDTEAAIFSSGLLDSFAVTKVMCFLEDAFGVEISPGDASLEDFDSLRRILDLLDRLQLESPAP